VKKLIISAANHAFGFQLRMLLKIAMILAENLKNRST